MKKKWLNKSNLGNALFFAILLVFIFSSDAKSWVMQGLMKVGFFQPEVNQLANTKPIYTTSVKFANQEGQVVDLDNLRGKVVFINFWATWCPPCIAEMPTINNFYQKYKDNSNLVFLMVDVDGDLRKSEQFMQRKNFSLKVWSAASEIPNNFLNESIPTTVILDKKGKMVFHHEGGADYENKDFQQFIGKLIAE